MPVHLRTMRVFSIINRAKFLIDETCMLQNYVNDIVNECDLFLTTELHYNVVLGHILLNDYHSCMITDLTVSSLERSRERGNFSDEYKRIHQMKYPIAYDGKSSTSFWRNQQKIKIFSTTTTV
jgi:hypothetical protein